MTRAQEFQAKADHFAVRADRASGRTSRNTCLSLEQSYRNLAAGEEERSEIANRDPEGEVPDLPPTGAR